MVRKAGLVLYVTVILTVFKGLPSYTKSIGSDVESGAVAGETPAPVLFALNFQHYDPKIQLARTWLEMRVPGLMTTPMPISPDVWDGGKNDDAGDEFCEIADESDDSPFGPENNDTVSGYGNEYDDDEEGCDLSPDEREVNDSEEAVDGSTATPNNWTLIKVPDHRESNDVESKTRKRDLSTEKAAAAEPTIKVW